MAPPIVHQKLQASFQVRHRRVNRWAAISPRQLSLVCQRRAEWTHRWQAGWAIPDHTPRKSRSARLRPRSHSTGEHGGDRRLPQWVFPLSWHQRIPVTTITFINISRAIHHPATWAGYSYDSTTLLTGREKDDQGRPDHPVLFGEIPTRACRTLVNSIFVPL